MKHTNWYRSLSRRDKIRYSYVRMVHRVEEWIDTKFDYPEWNNNTEKLRKLICVFLGHEPIPDHCGIPAHDLCENCGKSMPYAFKRDKA